MLQNSKLSMDKGVSVNAIVSTPLKGSGSLWRLATVLNGEHKTKQVCILVEFSDGFCICDMGEDIPMEIIHVDDLNKWVDSE